MSEVLSDYTGKAAPELVTVGGVNLELKEFNMTTRALWLDVAKKFELSEAQYDIQTKVIPKISSISNDIQNDPRLKSAEAKLEKLSERHDALIEVYATDDEPDDIDAQIESLIVRMEQQQKEVSRIEKEVQAEAFQEAKNAEKAVSDFMELQDKAKVYFVWSLVKDVNEGEEGFEAFYNSCNAEDYAAADRYINEGNARWASLYQDRMQGVPKTKLKN